MADARRYAAHRFGRTSELGGRHQNGDRVVLWYGSGNRDEKARKARRVHKRPRPAGTILSFGSAFTAASHAARRTAASDRVAGKC